MMSGIVMVRIQTRNSARYATVSATPTRSSVGSARSVRDTLPRLRNHLPQDVLERRVLDREIGGAQRAEQVADDAGQLALGHAQRDPVAVPREHGAELVDIRRLDEREADALVRVHA